jgi:hypothetical protein
MANSKMMSYLSAPLREVAQHHLKPNETILTAIYAHHTVFLARGNWLRFTWYRQVHHPTRAFVLTTERALILEDPTDPATSTAEHEYLFASCALDRVIFFELRSHLLDCALTIVMATSNGPERVTIEYSGVSEDAFLATIACMRTLIDSQTFPSSTQPYAPVRRSRRVAWKGWHAALSGLELRQENAVARYLVAGEHVQEWLSVPVIDESTWWQRLGIGAHEQPPAVLVRTSRQLLLVKESRRIVRGQMTYGSDAWLMPKARLRMATIVPGQREPELQLTLEHLRVTDTIRLPVLPGYAERALVLVLPHLSARGE